MAAGGMEDASFVAELLEEVPISFVGYCSYYVERFLAEQDSLGKWGNLSEWEKVCTAREFLLKEGVEFEPMQLKGDDCAELSLGISDIYPKEERFRRQRLMCLNAALRGCPSEDQGGTDQMASFFLARAHVLTEMRRFGEAVRDCEFVLDLATGHEVLLQAVKQRSHSFKCAGYSAYAVESERCLTEKLDQALEVSDRPREGGAGDHVEAAVGDQVKAAGGQVEHGARGADRAAVWMPAGWAFDELKPRLQMAGQDVVEMERRTRVELELGAPPHGIMKNVSSKLLLQKNNKYGLHWVAEEDIEAGEILIIEAPTTSTIHGTDEARNCYSCFACTDTPYPCPTCLPVVFCSQECMNRPIAKAHREICQFVDRPGTSHALRYALMASHIISQKDLKDWRQFFSLHPETGIDKDKTNWLLNTKGNVDDSHLLYCLPRTEGSRVLLNERDVQDLLFSVFFAEVLLKVHFHGERIKEKFVKQLTLMVVRLVRTFRTHAVQTYEVRIPGGTDFKCPVLRPVALAMYPSLAFALRCGDPNVFATFHGNKIVVRAWRPISAKEMILRGASLESGACDLEYPFQRSMQLSCGGHCGNPACISLWNSSAEGQWAKNNHRDLLVCCHGCGEILAPLELCLKLDPDEVNRSVLSPLCRGRCGLTTKEILLALQDVQRVGPVRDAKRSFQLVTLADKCFGGVRSGFALQWEWVAFMAVALTGNIRLQQFEELANPARPDREQRRLLRGSLRRRI